MAERKPWWKAFSGRVLGNILKDAAAQQDQCLDSKNSGFDVSQLEPASVEGPFCRNLSVSRSGRFKEKRKIRASLPASTNFHDSNTAVAK